MFCESCGTQNPEKASFCSRCGKRIRPATAPPAVPPPEVQNLPTPPPSGTGASWIDPQAVRSKPGDSWVQTDTPPLNQQSAAQIPAPPPPPPPAAPPPPSGANWIDPAVQQSAKPADSWVKFGQPGASAQGSFRPPPAQTYAQPGNPPPAYNPAYGQPSYPQGFPPQGYAMPGPAQFLRGVGGWLMFFVVSLTILGPLCSLFLVIVFLMAAGANVNTDPVLSHLFAAFALVIIPYSVWGLFVGMGLWKIRPGAVRQAKQYLLWGGISYTFIFNLLPFIFLPPSHRGDQLGSTAFVGIVIGVALALIWNSYFTKSRRVANTYPQG